VYIHLIFHMTRNIYNQYINTYNLPAIVPETAISPPRTERLTCLSHLLRPLRGTDSLADWILRSTTRATTRNTELARIPCIYIVMARLHDLGIFMVYMDSHNKSSLHYHRSNGVSLRYKIGIEYLSPTCTCIE